MPPARQNRTALAAWVCPSCKRAVSTRYCPACGERSLRPSELTLRGLAGEVFEALTNIDGRLLNSFRYLLTRPGALTVFFLEGRRKPFIGPVALFLVANVLFFATESMTRGLVFSTPLDSHLHAQPWSPLAQTLVAQRVAALQTTLDAYAPRFDGAIALNARSLVLVMTVAFAILAAVVFRRGKHPFAAHAAFSLHLYGFMLLVLCVGMAIEGAGMRVGGAQTPSPLLDAILSTVLLLVCGVYLFLAIGTVYRWRGPARVMASIGLTVGVAAIVLGYRFALMLLTLYTT